jgi:hypothetical protein
MQGRFTDRPQRPSSAVSGFRTVHPGTANSIGNPPEEITDSPESTLPYVRDNPEFAASHVLAPEEPYGACGRNRCRVG